MSFIKPYVYFIALSFLTSLIVYFNPRYTKGYLKFFPPFLFGTLIIETIGLYLGSAGRNNLFLYNFFTVIEFNFYFLVISSWIHRRSIKIVIWLTIIFYTAIAVINILFFQGIKTFHTTTYALGCLLIVIFCIFYFLELFKLPRSVQLWKSPTFWICAGLIFFYSCGFPLFALINYWQKISLLVINNFSIILEIMNIFLYSLFIIGFLCSKRRNYISSLS